MFHTLQWDNKIKEVTINNTMNATQGLLPMEVLLDMAGDISVIHPMLLQVLHPAERKIWVKGERSRWELLRPMY